MCVHTPFLFKFEKNVFFLQQGEAKEDKIIHSNKIVHFITWMSINDNDKVEK